MLRFQRARENGRAQAVVTCVDCADAKIFACEIDNEGQARRHLVAAKWVVGAKMFRCPDCEIKRKEARQMTKTTEPAPQPDRAQKRQIIDMLSSVYDTGAERYHGGETDETVAAALDLRPGWVAQIREELFGPCGTSEDMDALADEIAALKIEGGAAVKAAQDAIERLAQVEKRTAAVEAHLAKIRKAVGPRVLRIAGI